MSEHNINYPLVVVFHPKTSNQMDTNKALKKLAVLVKNSRAELGMTQRQYLALFGDQTPSISNLEKANYVNLPDHGTLQKIAEILRIPYWKLIKHLESDDQSELQLPTPLSKEQLIAEIKRCSDLECLLDLQFELSVQIERNRK